MKEEGGGGAGGGGRKEGRALWIIVVHSDCVRGGIVVWVGVVGHLWLVPVLVIRGNNCGVGPKVSWLPDWG